MTKPRLHPRSQALIDSYLSRPTHAVLLSGKTGVGKWTTAQWLGAQLASTRPAFQLLRFEPSQTNTISIDDIHRLRQALKLQNDVSRVVLVREAAAMTDEAQNAFLKLLEEPPGKVFFVLTSAQPNSLRETVRSRVQRIPLDPVTEAQALEHFADADPEIIKQLYVMSGGSIGMMTSLLGDESSEHKQLIAQAKELLGQSKYQRLARINELSSNRPQSLALLDNLLLISHLALRAHLKRGERGKAERWIERLEVLEAASANIKNNGNIKLQLGQAFLSL